MFKRVLKLKSLRWFGIIVLFTAVTLLITYLVPGDSWFAFLRYVFGFVFVAFFPGYCLVTILFTGKNRIDIVEQLVLSIGLSFSLDGLIGLFLGLSPIGLNLTSIATSLSAVVLVLAAIAFILKNREPAVPTETANPIPATT